MNDLINKVIIRTQAKINMYADDTVLLVDNTSPAYAVENMQRAVDEVADWCKGNKMTVNAKKTKHYVSVKK